MIDDPKRKREKTDTFVRTKKANMITEMVNKQMDGLMDKMQHLRIDVDLLKTKR